ncbi:SIR2 family protein [Parasulfuritortus cantonensis]|uniref:SIR2 family protein n=1 Tax=Parasulfuritortus cantonensis TaxID=2528202 RepID=A0A4R1B7F5_9PROT|nr:SIR2 family protein [Parasulfuritortus cantonensis]TCJ11539.1 SIR2 family protein [Parasulfuritortus cantonensis]
MSVNFEPILAALRDGSAVPYLGAGALAGVADDAGRAIPADSDSLILAMNGGKPMAPKLMYEFPRAAMNVELKKGRSALTRFLDATYRDTAWSASPLHGWLAGQGLPYVIDVNRDTLLQQAYAASPHTLIVGIARISANGYRFKLFQWDGAAYRAIDPEAVDVSLPVLFKPLGTPLPESNYIASDADFVDYITELMGGFAIPPFLKRSRQGKRYLLLGMRLTRDTERMVLSDVVFGNAGGWALIPNATDKEKRFLDKLGFELLPADCADFLAAATGTEPLKVAA